jgi:hypothetical protein
MELTEQRHYSAKRFIRYGSGKLATTGAIMDPFGDSPIRYQLVSTMEQLHSAVEPTVEDEWLEIQNRTVRASSSVPEITNLNLESLALVGGLGSTDVGSSYALSGTFLVNVGRVGDCLPSTIHSDKVRSLLALQENWDGDGAPAPNMVAGLNADRIMTTLRELDFHESRIMPSVEGGIAIAFQSGNKYSDLEALNSGAILAVRSDRRSDPVVWEIQPAAISETLKALRDFLVS